jgi:hypothetical protein
MTLNLTPDIEARLAALAQSRGLSIESFLTCVVGTEEENFALPLSSPAHRLSPEQWSAQFEEWADSFPEAPPIPDAALSRENLYPDRW